MSRLDSYCFITLWKSEILERSKDYSVIQKIILLKDMVYFKENKEYKE